MSINKVTLVGRLGNEPEAHDFEDGGSVCNIRLATSRRWTDRESSERIEETEWHSLVFRNGLSKVVAEHLHKGDLIYVEGRLKTRPWTDKDGHDRQTTEIIVGELEMLGGRPQEEVAEPAKAKGKTAKS